MNFFIFWGAVIVSHPFILKLSFNYDIRGGADYFFFCAVMISILCFGIKEIPKIIKVIGSGLIGLNLLFQYDFNSYFSLTQTVSMGAGLLFIAQLTERIERNHFLNLLVFMSIITTLYAVIEWLGFDVKHLIAKMLGAKVQRVYSGVGGILENPNVSGAYLAVCIPAFFRDGFKKWLWIPLVGTLFNTIWPNVTILSMGMMFFFLNHKSEFWGKKQLPYALFLVAFACFVFSLDYQNLGIDSGRVLSWHQAINLFDRFDLNSLFGGGLGWFAENFSRHHRPFTLIMKQEHNEFLAAYFAFGFVGVFALLYSFFKMSQTQDKIVASAIFGIFVNMMCNFTFHMSALFAVCAIWFALALKEVKYVEKMERKVASR